MLKNIISYSLIIIFLVLVYIVSGEMILIWAASALFGMILLSGIAFLIVSKRIVLTAEIDSREQRNQTVKLVLNVVNKSLIPFVRGRIYVIVENTSFNVKQKFVREFSSLDKNKDIEIKIHSLYCGKMKINIRSIRVFDLMGITSHRRFRKEINDVYIFPEYSQIAGVTEYVSQSYEKEKYFRNKKNSNLSEILQYREYQKGDALKLINWKLTDKFGQLMVREFDTPLDNNILVIFDINSEDKACRSMLCGALMAISDAYICSRIEHQMGWYNSVSGKLCVKEITEKNDLFDYMRIVFDRFDTQNSGALDRIIMNNSIYRFARIIYLTNEMTPNLSRALIAYRNIDAVIIDEKMAHGTNAQNKIENIAV